MQSLRQTVWTRAWIITLHVAVTSQRQAESKFRVSDPTLKCCCGDFCKVFFFFFHMLADILISVAFTHALSAHHSSSSGREQTIPE